MGFYKLNNISGLLKLVGGFSVLLILTANCFAENLVVSQPGVVFPLLAPRLSSGFGLRNHPIKNAIKHHNGVDLVAPEKSHVRSILSGMVIYAGTLSGYGKVVTVKHGDDNISLYGHLSSINVAVGESVSAGTIVGRVGSTGRVTGPHLHFEWRKGRRSLNPLKVFPDLATEPVG